MSNPLDIIAACTRNGATSWQNVARQLGRSVDSVRAQYDAGYERAYVWAPTREAAPEPAPEDLIEPADADIPMNSPHAKGPSLRILILQRLQHGAQSADTVANFLHRPVNSVRARLDRLLDDFLVCHDGRYPRTWSLTAKGLRIAVTGCEVRAKERV